MSYAYRKVASGQTVTSNEPRPDLDALARWETIDPDTATANKAGTDSDGRPDLEALTVDTLRAYATERSIDLHGATLKADIIVAIDTAE